MKNKKSLYIAGPYSHKYDAIRQYRFAKLTSLAAKLIDTDKYIVFSPITHSHPIAPHISEENYNWEFWSEQDYWFLEKCDILLVYMLDGWKESVGVTAEIKFAKKHGKEIIYVREEDVNKLIKGV